VVETDAGIWDGSTITIDVSGLSVGVYEYTCSVSDESGHSVTDSVQVTVLERTEGEQVPDLPLIPTNKFAIYDGKIVYEQDLSLYVTNTEPAAEWEIQNHITTVITVTSISSDIVRFSEEVTFNINDAYQIVGENTYTPESYGFRYKDAHDNILEEFDDTTVHTATFVRDVSKTTGMLVRIENPMGLEYLEAVAYYSYDVWGYWTTRYPYPFITNLTHFTL